MPESSNALVLLGLPLSGAASESWIEAAGGYRIRALAGGDYGDPAPLDVTVPSSLEDGDLVETERYGNREIVYSLIVEAATAAGLARGEADLMGVVGRRGELLWTPPAVDGHTTCYQVQTSHLEWVTGNDVWDLDEMDLHGAHPYRTYRLRVTASPFGLSAATVVTPLIGDGSGTIPAPTPAVTALNHPDASLAGWSTTVPGGVVNMEPGGVANRNLATDSGSVLTYTGSWAMAGDRWLRIEGGPIPGPGVPPAPAPGLLIAAGGAYHVVQPTATLGQHTYYLLPVGIASISGASWLIPRGHLLLIREVARTNVLPFATTTRQLVSSVEVRGSARTPASLLLEHDTLPLGQALVFSWRDDGSGYVPPLSRSATPATVASGVTSVDAVNGRYLLIQPASPAVFEVPASQVPEGSFTVPIRAKVPSAGGRAVTVTSEMVIDGVVVESVTTWVRHIPLTTAYQFVAATVAPVVLPPVRVPRENSTATVRVTISVAAGDLHLDEAYLCHTGIGALTIVDCGTQRRLEINSPTVDLPEPTIMIGTNVTTDPTTGRVTATDMRHINQGKALVAERHEWRPGQTNVLTSCAATDVGGLMTYRVAHQHNATE